jgi:hypothetical protein
VLSAETLSAAKKAEQRIQERIDAAKKAEEAKKQRELRRSSSPRREPRIPGAATIKVRTPP